MSPRLSLRVMRCPPRGLCLLGASRRGALRPHCVPRFRVFRGLSLMDLSQNDDSPSPVQHAVSGSCCRGTQLRGCPPAFGLLLDAAALSAPPARSYKQVGVRAAQTTDARCRGRCSGWRSVDLGFCQIKEEAQRAGGHSRSHPLRRPRPTHAWDLDSRKQSASGRHSYNGLVNFGTLNH
jgi:hypothetical protein